MNNRVFIPSNSIGDLYLDVLDMHWYMYNSICLNFQKEIPFFKLLLDMASLRMRYYLQLNGNRVLVPQTLNDIRRISTYLIKRFITIKSLSEDFFVQAILKLLITVWRFRDNMKIVNHLIFFIADKWEIHDALKKNEG